MTDGGRGDEEAHKAMSELMEELRVALPGVEVLFAFLLTVPFTQRFTELSERNQDIFFTAFVSAGVAIVLLISPSVVHRVLHGSAERDWIVDVSTWLAILGTVALLIAVSASMFLVADLIYDSTVAAIATACVAGLAVSVWFALPLARRMAVR